MVYQYSKSSQRRRCQRSSAQYDERRTTPSVAMQRQSLATVAGHGRQLVASRKLTSTHLTDNSDRYRNRN